MAKHFWWSIGWNAVEIDWQHAMVLGQLYHQAHLNLDNSKQKHKNLYNVDML